MSQILFFELTKKLGFATLDNRNVIFPEMLRRELRQFMRAFEAGFKLQTRIRHRQKYLQICEIFGVMNSGMQ